jgi:spore coat polysaccharide biosynthesis protein SpsF
MLSVQNLLYMKKHDRKKVIAVIQARMGSTRLPGKVLKRVQGKSIVAWIYYRLSFAKELDGIVLATSTKPENDPLEVEAKHLGLPCYRGEESDLIGRFYGVATAHGADAVVRICGDCALVDPAIVDRLVAEYQRDPDRLDFICNNAPPTYPHGMDVEVLPTRILKKLNHEIHNPLYREWLTMNIIENRPNYRIKNVEIEPSQRNFRLTIDYAEDLELVEQILQFLHTEGEVFSFEDVIDLFSQKPNLQRINARWLSTELKDDVRKNEEFQNLKSKNNDKK